MRKYLVILMVLCMASLCQASGYWLHTYTGSASSGASWSSSSIAGQVVVSDNEADPNSRTASASCTHEWTWIGDYGTSTGGYLEWWMDSGHDTAISVNADGDYDAVAHAEASSDSWTQGAGGGAECSGIATKSNFGRVTTNDGGSGPNWEGDFFEEEDWEYGSANVWGSWNDDTGSAYIPAGTDSFSITFSGSCDGYAFGAGGGTAWAESSFEASFGVSF